MAVSKRALEGSVRRRIERWRSWRRSEAMKPRRSDLASENLRWEKREGRRERREGRELCGKVGRCVWAHLKKKMRMFGLEIRFLEERIELISGGVRWGMYVLSAWSGILLDVRIVVMVWMSSCGGSGGGGGGGGGGDDSGSVGSIAWG